MDGSMLLVRSSIINFVLTSNVCLLIGIYCWSEYLILFLAACGIFFNSDNKMHVFVHLLS